MQTYMALCGDGTEDCADVDSSQAKWFKIDEQGIEDDGSWAQAELSTLSAFSNNARILIMIPFSGGPEF